MFIAVTYFTLPICEKLEMNNYSNYGRYTYHYKKPAMSELGRDLSILQKCSQKFYSDKKLQ